MSTDLWEYRPGSHPAADLALVGYEVHATDGPLGRVEQDGGGDDEVVVVVVGHVDSGDQPAGGVVVDGPDEWPQPFLFGERLGLGGGPVGGDGHDRFPRSAWCRSGSTVPRGADDPGVSPCAPCAPDPAG